MFAVSIWYGEIVEVADWRRKRREGFVLATPRGEVAFDDSLSSLWDEDDAGSEDRLSTMILLSLWFSSCFYLSLIDWLLRC